MAYRKSLSSTCIFLASFFFFSVYFTSVITVQVTRYYQGGSCNLPFLPHRKLSIPSPPSFFLPSSFFLSSRPTSSITLFQLSWIAPQNISVCPFHPSFHSFRWKKCFTCSNLERESILSWKCVCLSLILLCTILIPGSSNPTETFVQRMLLTWLQKMYKSSYSREREGILEYWTQNWYDPSMMRMRGDGIRMLLHTYCQKGELKERENSLSSSSYINKLTTFFGVKLRLISFLLPSLVCVIITIRAVKSLFFFHVTFSSHHYSPFRSQCTSFFFILFLFIIISDHHHHLSAG